MFLIDLVLNKYQSTGNFNNPYSRVHFGTHMYGLRLSQPRWVIEDVVPAIYDGMVHSWCSST